MTGYTRCPRTNKIGMEKMQAVLLADRKSKNCGPMEAYLCRHCKRWHLCHVKGYNWKKRQKAIITRQQQP